MWELSPHLFGRYIKHLFVPRPCALMYIHAQTFIIIHKYTQFQILYLHSYSYTTMHHYYPLMHACTFAHQCSIMTPNVHLYTTMHSPAFFYVCLLMLVYAFLYCSLIITFKLRQLAVDSPSNARQHCGFRLRLSGRRPVKAGQAYPRRKPVFPARS